MKKIIALLLAVLCMAVFLTACNNSKPTPTPTPEPVVEETAPAEESAAPTEEPPADEPPADEGAGETEDAGEETGDA